ncbi:MAG: TIGR00268 family protein [Geminicoccaceae bacterium]|nr:MAG: TIGR00268 family protein [Geminicoccaceae bacterium]
MSSLEPDIEPAEQLRTILAGFDRLAVAVSGGVDSTTLGVLAHRLLGERALLVHAVSPAVPAAATARLRDLATREGAALRLLDAGEFADPRYRANPVDRCYFCKANLYAAIRRIWEGPIASGTNRDDLGDFRPGLSAAAESGIRHPYVEAGLDKVAVRRLARALGLAEIADLPASPCLASRIETGIAVSPERVALVAAVERLLEERFGPGDQRCRIRADRIDLELEAPRLAALGDADRAALLAEASAVVRAHGVVLPLRLAAYVRGSAFLRPRAR